MLDEETIKDMARTLYERGSAHVQDQDGNYMVITASAVVGVPGNRFLLAYENKGAILFDTSRPMNQFRLASAGFSLRIAPVLADTLNRLFAAVTEVIGDTENGLDPIGVIQ